MRAAFENMGRAIYLRPREELLPAMSIEQAAAGYRSALLQASESGFAVPLMRARPKFLAARCPKEGRPPSLMMASMYGSSHGVASLFGRGGGARRKLR